MADFVKAAGLVKKYGDFHAVHDIDFTVEKGTVFGIIGPNGAGKTTTLRMICGILDPTEGSVNVGGLDTLKDKVDVKRKIGYLPEEDFLYGGMKVHEHLKYIGELFGVKDPDNRVDWALSEVDIDFKRDSLVRTLSRGQKRRVALAKALLHDPQLLILDEVTSGLDPVYKKKMIELVAKFNEHGKTVIFSTHILDEATRLCDKIMIINHGKRVGYGTIKELKKQTGTGSLDEAFFQLVDTNEDDDR